MRKYNQPDIRKDVFTEISDFGERMLTGSDIRNDEIKPRILSEFAELILTFEEYKEKGMRILSFGKKWDIDEVIQVLTIKLQLDAIIFVLNQEEVKNELSVTHLNDLISSRLRSKENEKTFTQAKNTIIKNTKYKENQIE